MTDPVRLQILKKLSDRLSEIDGENGYYKNLSDGVKVFRGRTVFGDNDPLPCLSILEDPRPESPQETSFESACTGRIAPLNLLIQGWAEKPIQAVDGGTDEAYYLLADVQRCLATIIKEKEGPDGADGILDNLVLDLYVGAPVVRPPDEYSDTAWFWLPIQLKYPEDLAPE